MAQILAENLEKEIRKLIAEIIEIDESKITSDAKFVEDLGMDSMMALEILSSVEKKYKIRIEEDNLPKITSLKSLTDMTAQIINQKAG